MAVPKKRLKDRGQLYMTFEEIPEVTPAMMHHAAIALIGAKLSNGEDPTCGLRDVVGALGLLGSPDEEEERPQVEVKKVRHEPHKYTTLDDIQIWDREYPDAELARKMKVSIASIQTRRHELKVALNTSSKKSR